MNEAADIDVSIVVPVYNGEAALEELTRRIREVFERLDRTYEIVLVDDGSADGSWQLIEQLAARGEPVRGFQLARNHGQHYALKCGLDHSRGDYVVTMDDDLQHPPEEIEKLIEALESNPEIDVVSGRYESKKHSAFRNLGARMIHGIERRIFRTSKGIYLGAFRIMRRSVVDQVRAARHAQPRIGPIILSITSRLKSVTVKHEPRRHGKSGYSLGKLVRDTLDSIMNYSALPLQIVSVIGISASIISVVLGGVYIGLYFGQGTAVSGFTTLVLLILFTSGAVLFSFGLVGEYLRRIVSQQLMFSQYHIRTEVSRRESIQLGDEPVQDRAAR